MASCSSIEEQGLASGNGSTEATGMEKARQKLLNILNNPAIKTAYELQGEYSLSAITEGQALDAQGQLLTRANEDDALYYTFSIDDNGGYAIIGNSPALPELIALSAGTDQVSEGSQADMEVHGGGIVELPTDLNIGVNDTASIIGPSPEDNPRIQTIRDSVTYKFIGPARPQTVSWGCEYPYNNMLPIDDIGRHANVGCVCIALAQFLTYKDFRPMYNQGQPSEKHFNWDLMSRYTTKKLEDQIGEMCDVGKNHIAPLCSLLNNPNNLDASFHWDGASHVFIYNVFHTLNKFNINCTLEDYDIEKVIAEMSTGEPVLITGGGHTWIIDAVMAETYHYTEVRMDTGEVISHSQKTRYLLHCNWGWDGQCNGYFYSGIFNPGKRPIIRGLNQSGNQPGEPNWETQNCNNNLRVFVDLYKF